MLDIGWGELLVIGVVALVVVGPKDLPGLFKTAGNFMGRARGMARDFQRSMEAAADEAGLKEASQSLKLDRLNLNSATSSARKYAETLVKDIDSAAGAPVAESNGPVSSAPALQSATGAAPNPFPTEPLASRDAAAP